MAKFFSLIITHFLGLVSPEINEPKAEIHREVVNNHGTYIVDDYKWMRDPKWPNIENPQIKKIIKEENDFTEKYFLDKLVLLDKIQQEFKSRKMSDYVSPPSYSGGYKYYYKDLTGKKSGRVYYRSKTSSPYKEEIVIDPQGFGGNTIDYHGVSSDHKYVAYLMNYKGSESYTIRVKEIEKGIHISDVITNVGSVDDEVNVIWMPDSSGFFYYQRNKKGETNSIYFHKLGMNPKSDKLIFQLKDEDTHFSMKLSKSEKYIIINCGSYDENEIYLLDLKLPIKVKRPLFQKKQNQLYSLDHYGTSFYVLETKKGEENNFIEIAQSNMDPKKWKYLLEKYNKLSISNFYVFNNDIVFKGMENGLDALYVLNKTSRSIKKINFPEELCSINIISDTNEVNDKLRISFSSLISPKKVLDYDFNKESFEQISETKVPNYNENMYASMREFATAPDGTKIPISLVYKKSLMRQNASNPILIYGYGAYGIVEGYNFNSNLVSLLDRGFVYAIAHVRGGGEFGDKWFDDGKKLKKFNTFSDFIACTEYLISKKYGATNKTVISGVSAGGLIVGAVLNLRPDLYKVAIAEVPFVDILNTMLDPNIPNVVNEFEDWGNPISNLNDFDNIRHYSPYDNIRNTNYPAMRVVGAEKDMRVPYWEPLKWVSKIRKLRSSKKPLILEIISDEGHFRSSDIIEAKNYTFILSEIERN